MKIQLKLFLPMLSQVLGKDSLTVDLPGTTAGDLVEHLVKRHGRAAAKALYDNTGQLDREVQLLVNQKTWVTRDNLDTALKDGDQVAIMVLMAGG